MTDSFFGFDTSLPPEDEIRWRNHKRNSGALASGLEDLTLEDGNTAGLGDDGDFDELNDETFGDLGDIGKDFDFASNTEKIRDTIETEESQFVRRPMDQSNEGFYRQTPSGYVLHREEDAHQSVPPFADGREMGSERMSSLWQGRIATQDSLHQLHQERKLEPWQRNESQTWPGDLTYNPQLQQQHSIPSGKVLSLAEVEAALLAGNNAPPAIFPPHVQQLDTIRLEQERLAAEAMERERKRRERHARMYALSKYNGLMTQQDKEHIHRIQVSQLVNDDPYADDFYFQVFNAIRNRSIPGGMPPTSGYGDQRDQRSGANQGGERRGRRMEQGIMRMQQQVQRMVNDARRKPKQTQVSLEGALGRITLHSVRNPRQVLQMSPKISESPQLKEATDAKQSSITSSLISNRKQTLRWVENIYSHLLKAEQLRRQQPQVLPGLEQEARIALQQWQEELNSSISSMWTELRITEPLGTLHPHPFVQILSISKGKKLIPRVCHQLSPDQLLTLVTMLVANFDTLDVCRGYMLGPAKELNQLMQEEIEIFMNSVVPPVLRFVAEAPFRIVIGLMSLMLERNNILHVAKSKVGLAFLTMFLSRAEILKQGLPPPNDREISQWQDLYNYLFSSLHHHFISLFPPPSAGDDMYVWQFMAAIAVGASVEQQHVLVTEIREKVLENVSAATRDSGGVGGMSEKAALKIANVNLFLHALGLDASQVALPPS
ncbi:uncharacterized protein VTP21DRAFT_2685 [Calcarisporiella thermophila]|uniref:uncharacterized protein n=1 Tax=Calcarisporiella thermophila TaxID=911321 RepID=UPI003741EB28